MLKPSEKVIGVTLFHTDGTQRTVDVDSEEDALREVYGDGDHVISYTLIYASD